MPHVSDVRATSPDHDGHDRVLVAALAAGDLAATDRDDAIRLIRSCSTCAELHDDLLAIARATASVPPIAARSRDFRLTPTDAARLHPAGWRGVVRRLSRAPRAVTRPLGAGLATIGLVGLLIGNAPAFSLGGAASIGAAASPGGASAEDAAAPAVGAQAPAPTTSGVFPVAASAAASAAAEFNANGQPSPSSGGRASGDFGATSRPSPAPAAAGPAAGGAKAEGSPSRDVLAGRSTSPAAPLGLTNVLFGAMVLAGIGLLIVSRRRGRQPV